jgi:cell division septation protein DedD
MTWLRYSVEPLTKYQFLNDNLNGYRKSEKIGVTKMVMRSELVMRAIAALALLAGAVPACADTKVGVDAWSRGEYEVAVKEWRQPALAGDADAQFNLGQAYKLGRGVKTDLDLALDWYRKAAAQGHIQAADSCGHLLHYQKKISEALPFLIASSDRGEPRAQYLLATELFNGINIGKDWVRAYALMTRASSAGMASASRSLAQMDQYIPIEERQAGTVLAGELEQRADRARTAQVTEFPIDSSPATGKLAPVVLPPSSAVAPILEPIKPKPAPIGAWRIQLGAFSNAANAEKLWKKVANNISELAGKKPILKSDGALTRLQAGPFTTKAQADAVCAKLKASGQQCLALSSS